MTRLVSLLCGTALLLSACTQSRLEGSLALSGGSYARERAIAVPADRQKLRAELLAEGRTGTFYRTGENRDHIAWRAPDGSGLVTKQGLLTSTFGLGFDLISADVSETEVRLREGRSGQATRVHRYLDGENQVIARAFLCEVRVGPAPAGRKRATETCNGADVVFENSYVLDAQGRIMTSTQWVGPEIGLVRLSRLDARGTGPVILVAGN